MPILHGVTAQWVLPQYVAVKGTYEESIYQ